MDNNIGKKLDGRYELLELIGVGGMADIYRAKDIQEDRIVAVKILKTEYAGSEEFLRRFRNESKAIALLSHPNIVKIYDVGFTDKVQFIVMEYVDGITLSDYIEQQGVLKWRDAVHFTVQTLRALQHAHDRGIVHRDIKSSNIMLLRDGTIKVMDFGIARFNRENNKTMSEKTIGSVHYISPEQARGDMTDERSDIYSVGVALYEMLTGRKPFDGDTPVAIALMHMQTEPKKPSELNETIPEGLEQIVMRAMQKEPNARYQTAHEMITDLEEFKKNPGMVFDYKYNSTDRSPKFSGVNPLTEQNAFRRKKAPDEPDDFDVDYDDYDEDYDDDDEVEERRSPLIPILFGVGAAFVIVVVFLVLYLVSDRLGGGNRNTSAVYSGNTGISFDINKNGELALPKFVGMTVDEVQRMFPDNSILNITYDQQYNDAPLGEIFEQEFPEDRRVMKGSSITLKVSKGKQEREVEDVSNRTEEAARKQLEKSGFTVRVVRDENNEVAKGYVIETVPPAHSMAEIGTTVTMVVSMGPDDKPFSMPKLVDMPLTDALERCKEYGLNYKVENVPSLTEKGTVLEQSIEPATMANRGDEILLKVSTGEEPSVDCRIRVTLPQNIEGVFEFNYYVGGKLDESASETRDVSLTKEVFYTVKNIREDEEKTFSIRVVCVKNGQEGTWLTTTAYVDEDGKAALKGEQKDGGIFDRLNSMGGSNNDTSVPETDTSAPESGEQTSNDDTPAQPGGNEQ